MKVNLITADGKDLVREVDLSEKMAGSTLPMLLKFDGKYYVYQSDTCYKEISVVEL